MPPVAALVAGISLTTVLTSMAISFVGNFVIGAISQALGGQDQPAAGVQPQTITLKQALAPWKVIYGRARVGGAWAYIHTTGNPVIGQNSALMGAIVLACHQCEAIEKIYFGDEEVKLDSSGNALGKWRNYVHIWKHLGGPGQPADQNLINFSDGLWTAKHRLAGRCYIAIDLAYNEDLFPSMPVISAQIKGRILLDHRDGGSRWSDNPVLAVSDYLRNPDYGMGFALSEFNLASWNAEANACDELVRSALVGGNWKLPSDSFTAETSKHYNYARSTSKTVASAFTIASDTLGLDTGDRVFLSGNALPTPLTTNTAYYVIRISSGQDYVYDALNVKRTPVIQLAASHADAVASTPVPVTITHNGIGTIWQLDDIWLTDVATKGFSTGDLVQVGQADANALPAPLVAGANYYWIDRGHQQAYYETTRNIVAYGHGMLAASHDDAVAGIPIALTSIGKGTYTVAKAYEKRWTCNGVVDTSAKPSDIIGTLLSSCGGKLVRGGDKWHIFTAVWRGVAGALSEADLRAPVKVNALVSRRDLFNAVRGTYISPGNFDQPSDFPPYPDPSRPDLDIFLAQDGSERIWSQDIQLPFTSTPSMAQRLAKVLLMQMRQQISIVFPAKLTAFGLTVGQVVNVTLARMGWAGKAFEIVDWTLTLESGGNDAPPVPGLDITLRETDPAVYEWDNGAETTGWWAPRTNLPTQLVVATPAVISVVESRYVTVTGAGLSSGVTVAWNPVGDASSYQVAYVDASANQIILQPQSAAQGTEAFIGPLVKGSYSVQVRTINTFGVAGAWSTPAPFTVAGVVGPPPDLVNFRVAALAGQAHVTWDLSADQDVVNGGHIWLRWSPLTVGATWPTATGLSLLLAGTATEATAPLKAGTYLGKAVDSAGNQSVNAVSWVIASVDQPGLELVLTNTESPGFAGTKTQLMVSGGVLQLDVNGGASTMDSWADVDAIADWDGEGALFSAGEYDFDTVTDLGAVFGFRIELDMTTVELGSSSLGDLAQAKIEPQISTTTDDPAGSPTWTDWQPFMIGDFVARGIRRRLLFSTDEPHHQIACSALEYKISMATRTWASASVALLMAGTRVNFSPAYYTAPEAWGNVVGGAAGDYVEVTSIDRQGATFTVKDNTGTAKNGTADLYAFGAGAEV